MTTSTNCPSSGFAQILEHVGIPVFTVDRAGDVSEWNAKMFATTGYRRNEVVGRPFSTLITTETQQANWISTWEACLMDEKDCATCDVFVRSQNDQIAPFRIKVTPQRDSGDMTVSGALCFLEELTVPDSSTASSQEEGPQLNGLKVAPSSEPINGDHPPPREIKLSVDTIQLPLFVVDMNGFVTLWNSKMAQLTGYEEHEFRESKKNLLDDQLFDKDALDAVHTAIAGSLAGEETCIVTRLQTREQKKMHHVSLNTCAQVNAKGLPVGVALLVRIVSTLEDDDDTVVLDHASLPQLLQQQQQQQHSGSSLMFLPVPDAAPCRRQHGGGGGGAAGQSSARVQQRDEEACTFLDTAQVPILGLNEKGAITIRNPHSERLFGPFESNLMDLLVTLQSRELAQEALDAALKGETKGNVQLEIRDLTGAAAGQDSESIASRYLLANFSPKSTNTGGVVWMIALDVTESALEDRAVAQVACELQQLVDTANASVIGVDLDGYINEWNDKAAEVTGYPADYAYGKKFIDTFVPAASRSSIACVLNGALKGRGTANLELELVTQTAAPLESRYLLVNATPRRNCCNTIIGAVLICQDITEAAKHDRAVAAMASELRQLIDTANAPIFGIDTDGDVNEWNDKAAEITGYTKAEAFDCNLVETFIVPHMQESVDQVFNNALSGRGTSNYELEFQTKAGEVRHLLINATTRRDAEAHVVGVVVVAQDVTEAVQRDRAVAGMALELRQLIDTANAPIFGIDIDGNVNEWNRRTQEITGYSKEETFDENLVESFIAPHMQSKVQEILDNALMGNETSNYELEFVSKSGEARFMKVNATTRRDPDTNVVGVVGVAQDVTEDRKHAAELHKLQTQQAANQAKVETERNMTAYFAHELRNPLGAIDSALNAMPMEELPVTTRDLVSGMQLCSSFMSKIMNNLLDVRKMEEGKMTLHAIPMSLSSLLDGVHKMLLPSVKPGVKFEQDSESVLSRGDWVLGDAHRIQQVWTNVVTNAIKYTFNGSIAMRLSWEEVVVEVNNASTMAEPAAAAATPPAHASSQQQQQQEGTTMNTETQFVVKFECIDTGPGIPKPEQEKLFQRFVQRGGAPGTGLGLAIAKHLVDLMNGSIRFYSDPTIQAGTTCVVTVPLALAADPNIPSSSSRPVDDEEDSSLLDFPVSFLIIDDIKMNRTMLKRRIQKGICPTCQIQEASTGEQALELCLSEFDVIIVDQYMEEAGGVMVGTDVVYAMRRMRIESIIIGCSGNDLRQEFLEAGADWVWAKPMPSNAKIIQHLRKLFARKGTGRRASTSSLLLDNE